jgi:putative intracellular protease/amidase/YHS domain-containing protein
MNRRQLLKRSAALGVGAAGSLVVPSKDLVVGAGGGRDDAKGDGTGADGTGAVANPLRPPAQGSIPVAFLISEGAVLIDFAGPWEVFQDVNIPGRSEPAFNLYTVAETANPVHTSGGMKITPNYTIANAPAPKVIVIPAQSPASDKTKEWIRSATRHTDVTMSVCTGAFVLASTGLLSGKAATTYHGAYVDLQKRFPDIQVKRGVRFVEAGNLASAGGLSSGIDLALRVVERYFGREVARQTAFGMEYQGEGWMNPDSNAVYARAYTQVDDHPTCPVCGMDPDRSLQSVYKGKTYYFCSVAHKQTFDESPEQFTK